MNARQKSKKYKKQMELYKYKADILDDFMKRDMRQKAEFRQLYGQVIPLRFQRLYRTEEYSHERAIRNELAWQIGDYIIEHDLAYIETSIDERNKMLKLDCKVEVIKR